MSGAPLPRVLVVDDEPMLLRVMARELRGAFEVVQAAGGAAAIAALEQLEDLAAVVTDLDMGPGPDGLAVLDEARRRRPGAVRILTSGRAHPDDVAEHVRAGLVGCFVQKPWTVGTLRMLLEEGLAAGCTMNQEAVMPDVALPEHATVDDAELVQQARQGDNAATATLLLRYRRGLLVRILKVYGVPRDDAADVLQDVYQRFVVYRPKLERVGALLMTLAEHASLDYHRRRRAEMDALHRYSVEHARVSDFAARPEKALVARLDARRALRVTTGRCRELFTAIVLCGTTHAEYAKQTGTPRGTIGTTLVRCFEKARRRLAAASKDPHVAGA